MWDNRFLQRWQILISAAAAQISFFWNLGAVGKFLAVNVCWTLRASIFFGKEVTTLRASYTQGTCVLNDWKWCKFQWFFWQILSWCCTFCCYRYVTFQMNDNGHDEGTVWSISSLTICREPWSWSVVWAVVWLSPLQIQYLWEGHILFFTSGSMSINLCFL